MKKFFALACLLALSAPALAQDAAPQKVYTCWYGADGKLKSAEPTTGDIHVRYLYDTGRGGDHAWAYAIHSDDGNDCPVHVPHN
jgi:hypothetical protein